MSAVPSPVPFPEAESPWPIWQDLFAGSALATPGKVAVISQGKTLTFSELEHRSNQFARFLLSQGIQPGSRVGLGLNRSIDLIIALFGILKSGASYIPLDPTYPQARLEQMRASAKIQWVISEFPQRSLFSSARFIDAHDPSLPTFSSDGLPHVVSANQEIYAIFTSGSTGTPKAAAVYHRGFANLLDWYRHELLLDSNDTALILSSPSFDLTQKNFFAPLINGGSIVLDSETTYDIPRISKLIREHQVTLINCTPSAFYPLVDAGQSGDFADLASLRFAVLGGEPISIPRLRAWLEHPACSAEVVNSYGPTECTDICLFHRMHRGNIDAFSFVPLGRNIPNVEVTLRDENLQPLPAGELGEICISGISVGAGYLHDPEKTADRFIDGIYRTGDLGIRHECGIYEFRGRADHQVKVNGFRIELGEIELALAAAAGIRETVVIAANNRIIAYIQGDAEISELRVHLSRRLPAYMIPSEFVFLETFPLTPNGKVDRKALQENSRAKTVEVSTEKNLEHRILQLWSELLDRPIQDVDANFFDLGGNSLHLAVMHVRLIKMADRDFPITELFSRPTARAIADFLSPQATHSNTTTIQDRARLAQSGFSRFRRPQVR